MDIEALAERLWLEYRWADVLEAVGLPVHTGRDGIRTPPHTEPTMIKADPGWVAQFEHGGVDEDVPIVAWSSEGGPLVVEWSTGNLVPPRELRDKGSFRRVVQKHTMATVPGAGWKLRRLQQWKNREDEWFEYGVVAFEFRHDGRVAAAVVGPNGALARYVVGETDGIEMIPPHRETAGAL